MDNYKERRELSKLLVGRKISLNTIVNLTNPMSSMIPIQKEKYAAILVDLIKLMKNEEEIIQIYEDTMARINKMNILDKAKFGLELVRIGRITDEEQTILRVFSIEPEQEGRLGKVMGYSVSDYATEKHLSMEE